MKFDDKKIDATISLLWSKHLTYPAGMMRLYKLDNPAGPKAARLIRAMQKRIKELESDLSTAERALQAEWESQAGASL